MSSVRDAGRVLLRVLSLFPYAPETAGAIPVAEIGVYFYFGRRVGTKGGIYTPRFLSREWCSTHPASALIIQRTVLPTQDLDRLKPLRSNELTLGRES